MLFWLNENVGFHPTFSRHAKADASIVLVIWLNENVPENWFKFHLLSVPSFAPCRLENHLQDFSFLFENCFKNADAKIVFFFEKTDKK